MSLAALEFELPRRLILFHSETEMPDESLLGYTGNPNNVNPANTPGETLIYNCPAGTLFLDKGVDPHVMWVKVQSQAGGQWVYNYDENSTIDLGPFT